MKTNQLWLSKLLRESHSPLLALHAKQVDELKAISEHLGSVRYAAPPKPLSRRIEEKFKQKSKAMKLCPVCGNHKPNKKIYFNGSICRYCRSLKKSRGGRDTS